MYSTRLITEIKNPSEKLYLHQTEEIIFSFLFFAFYPQIDDQIALLINAWCELLVFSCCYRSVSSPGVIRVSNEKSLTLEQAREFGIEKCVEKMLNFTEQLRRLKVDYYEYVSMKVIVLLTSGKKENYKNVEDTKNISNLSEGPVKKILHRIKCHLGSVNSTFFSSIFSDASGLKEPEHVRDSQEKVVQSLQQYTTANCPDLPTKFGELLLRMPELQRVCQVRSDI